MREHLTIPGIGMVRPTFDKFSLLTDVPSDELKRHLSRLGLGAFCHALKVEKVSNRRGSRLVAVCLPDRRTLALLYKHEADLQPYRITTVEVSYDIPAPSLTEAKRIQRWIAKLLKKSRHQRGYLTFQQENAEGQRLSLEQLKKRGLVDEPTVYFEKKGAAHGLKIYIRREKRAQGRFGQFVVRIEWTSTKSRAVMTRFGGNQIGDLLAADLTAYLHENLILERIDYTRLGKLIRGQHARRGSHLRPDRTNQRGTAGRLRQQFDSEEYWVQRRAHLLIKVIEERSWPHDTSGEPIPEDVWRTSPAQIRGRFRRHLAEVAKKSPKPGTRRRRMLTMRKLERCFISIPVRRVGIRLNGIGLPDPNGVHPLTY